ncbi:hypothetical protein ACROYT_G024289 [Oculina patagonica]
MGTRMIRDWRGIMPFLSEEGSTCTSPDRSSGQCTGDNGREKKTKTPEQHQHLAGLFSAYVILYRETRRHEKKIKTQQLPQEEVERFAKESKALKTTVFVVSAVVLSFLPMAFTLLFSVTGLNKEVDIEVYVVLMPLIRTCAMLNSLLNPLIYCLRQKEMRKFVFRVPCRHAVQPAMNDTDITF